MYDNAMGFSVCGGDQIAVILSRVLEAKQLIFATDVAGIYDKDPKSGENVQLLREINVNNIENLITRMKESSESDASGRMQGKLRSLTSIKDLIQQGLEVGGPGLQQKIYDPAVR